MLYEALISKYSHLTIKEATDLPTGLGGLYYDNVILLDKYRSTREKYCLLAEELGHYHTSSGNIVDQFKLENRKQEKRARAWAYEKVVPLEKIIQAHQGYISNKYELAKFLEVTESFLESALERYKERYGGTVNHNGYTICFEPLGVIEWFDKIF